MEERLGKQGVWKNVIKWLVSGMILIKERSIYDEFKAGNQFHTLVSTLIRRALVWTHTQMIITRWIKE